MQANEDEKTSDCTLLFYLALKPRITATARSFTFHSCPLRWAIFSHILTLLSALVLRKLLTLCIKYVHICIPLLKLNYVRKCAHSDTCLPECILKPLNAPRWSGIITSLNDTLAEIRKHPPTYVDGFVSAECMKNKKYTCRATHT